LYLNYVAYLCARPASYCSAPAARYFDLNAALSAMRLAGCAAVVAACLLLGPAPSTGRKAGRRKRVGHDPFLQSTSPALFDASTRHEPYATLEQRDAALPCTIERREGLTRAQFEAEFFQKKPVVLVGGSGLLERGAGGKNPQDVRLSPGALGTAQVEIPKLLTETYAQVRE
jgi:hypothetical protein